MGNDLRALKGMVSIMNPSGVKSPIFKGVKMPYKRKKEVVKRQPYDLAEARLRSAVVKILRKKGFEVKRVETLARGFGDLWISHYNGKLAGWVELKTPSGVQSIEQKDFETLCLINKIPYLVIRTEEEAENIFWLASKLF